MATSISRRAEPQARRVGSTAASSRPRPLVAQCRAVGPAEVQGRNDVPDAEQDRRGDAGPGRAPVPVDQTEEYAAEGDLFEQHGSEWYDDEGGQQRGAQMQVVPDVVE